MLLKLMVPFLVFIVGTVATVLIGVEVDSARKRLLTAELKANMESWISVMEFSTEKEVTLAKTLVSVFEDSPTINPQQFDRLSKNAIQLYPDLDALFWVPAVTEEQRSVFESAMNANQPDFVFKMFAGRTGFIPALTKAVYYPVYYLNGSESSRQYSGWDLGGFGDFDAMFSSLSLVDGQVAMRFIPSMDDLLSTENNRPRLQLLLATALNTPVKLPNGSVQMGDGYLVFLVNFALIFNYFGEIPGGDKLDISVTMGSGSAKHTVFSLPPTSGELQQDYRVKSAFTNRASSSWEVTLVPTDEFFASKTRGVIVWVLAAGFAITLSLSIYLFAIQRRTGLIREIVELRTKELQKANHELDRLSRTDYLTGVANRRFFEESLEREWSRAARGKHPITLLMIDVDYFKTYNDRYGHIEGDVCLQQLCHAFLKSIKRPTDLVARFGGEEFVVLLPETDKGATALAERCRRAVEELEIAHADSEISDFVTVSIGLVTLIPMDNQSSKTLVKAADDALYQAKEQGRNRVRIS
jgi:diguanylate cyclase (GGDEF)-like protein